MIKLFLIILITILTALTGFSQTKITSIDISGNDYLSFGEITNLMITKKDGNYKEDQFFLDLKTIRDKYKSAGYLYIKFDKEEVIFSDDSSFAEIKIVINEGKKVEVGKINIDGNTTVSDKEILNLFKTKVNDNLNDYVLNDDIQNLLKLYESKKLPFAKIKVKDISVYKDNGIDKINLDLVVTENSKVQISQVKIKGNETTEDYVIIRELKLNKNEYITSASLQQMKERLDRLNIFEFVDNPKIYSATNNKNESGLLIEVKEGNTNTFDGILGYNPPNGNETSGYLTGLVNISIRNLFGTGRKIQARYQQVVRETQELEFAYLEPYFFKLPLNINFGFLQRIQDTAYTLRNLDLKGDFLFSNQFTFSILAGYNRVIPSDVINPAFIVEDSRILSSGLQLTYDNRDNIFVPSKGFLYNSLYSYGSKKVFNSTALTGTEATANYSVQRYYLGVDFYSSFVNRQTTLIRLFGGEVKSANLDESDLFRIGGNKYIRGYRSEQYLASRLAAMNIELRYSISRKGFLFGFYDSGYYLRPYDALNNYPEQSGFLYGYGIGIRLESGLGIIGVSYALGKDAGILDGIINFGLVNDF
ncbi:MAG: BamA/TamA family outer membrane protein [Ignavibacteria bacterium]|nr:BamA/TamA family outer membrane protein [Ignavibacteria bacterium]